MESGAKSKKKRGRENARRRVFFSLFFSLSFSSNSSPPRAHFSSTSFADYEKHCFCLVFFVMSQ